ncbi:c-type cytochrome [Hydrogenophaga sp. SL48]|jgi:mono/diheme cytochrome c family protein|uniref:c-type cytochrome n=1 Tax=Hydrogenophaga sp. SL48 TaxID=2806347 RepID=UPI001F02FE81|nr:c-type cytochrome [Hydrogenophaga sp. SL48]UJW80351.1 c-type cytochrome [Hydrogenophaga sp. SL48]
MIRFVLCALALTLSGFVRAQSAGTPDAQAVSVPPATPFTAEMVEKGREQFHRTCAQCHGRNMVNSGTTVYDLRKFPTEQRDRFYTSVTNGKGNMPSFKGALEPGAIELLWSYVATRGGKEL